MPKLPKAEDSSKTEWHINQCGDCGARFKHLDSQTSANLLRDHIGNVCPGKRK